MQPNARPPATPAGDYTLLAGLYDASTGKRLPLTVGPGTGDDKIVLGRVTVRAE